MKIYLKLLAVTLTAIAVFLVFSRGYANADLISLFPLDRYSQTVSDWIKPTDPEFNSILLSAEQQQKHIERFYNHYVGSFSPWNASYVNQILRQTSPSDLKNLEQSLMQDLSNDGKSSSEIGYGENFRPHVPEWIDEIAKNIDLGQLDDLSYQASHRGIAIDNLHARALPTEDVHFYDYHLAGQGYPFDNLQMSALWAGTPVYIISETRDHAWLLVMTPEYIAWVKSQGIARADNQFIETWSTAAKTKLAAITQTKTSMVDQQGIFHFAAYVGAVFPATVIESGLQLMIPVANWDHQAIIKYASLSPQNATPMPLAATPQHFAMLINTLIRRPYGWGGMYFYNDCSAELKSLLTPFGIWLPRHSADQVTVGKRVDMTSASPTERLAYLMENGQRFLTIIYIGGHVMLYIGSYPNPNQTSTAMAMTYQNLWGLSPRPSIRRAVVGGSVLFPMLLQYPEDPSLISLADKGYFQVSYLNQLPTGAFFMQEKIPALKSLMYPFSTRKL